MNPHPFDYLSVCLSVFHLVSLSVCQSVYIFVILHLYKESRGLAWKKKKVFIPFQLPKKLALFL